MLAQEHGRKLNTILKDSDTAFEQAKDKFLDKFEGHLKTLTTKLCTPEQSTRRDEIKCQLSQNMAHPDRQK